MSFSIRPFLLAWFSLAGVSPAGTIEWGTSVKDALYDSDAQPLTSSFQFTLGTFDSSFTPTGDNLDLWEANWKPIETAAFNATLQYATESTNFTGTSSNLIWARDDGDPALPASNPNTFAAGQQVYLWVYNTKTQATGTEWALITGTGSTPDTLWQLNADLANPTSPTSYNWRLSTANTIVLGGLNSVDGFGDRTTDPVTFSLQTAALVPEPGLGLLLPLGLLLLCRRSPRAGAGHPA